MFKVREVFRPRTVNIVGGVSREAAGEASGTHHTTTEKQQKIQTTRKKIGQNLTLQKVAVRPT
jgi:hypothetical protein